MMMKFEALSPERVTSTDQTWMNSCLSPDVTVICLEDDDMTKVEFRCHKLMIIPLISQYCPINSINNEEIEQVMMPNLTPSFFKQYLNHVYGGLEKSKNFSYIPLPPHSDNPNLINVKNDTGKEVTTREYIEEDLVNEDLKCEIDDDTGNDVTTKDGNILNDLVDEELKCKIDKTDAEDIDSKPLETKKPNMMRKRRNIVCPVATCCLVFARNDNFKTHFLKKHPEKEYIVPKMFQPRKLPNCKKCDVTFPSRKEERRHYSQKHTLKKGSFACEYCGQSFTRKSNVRNHITEAHSVFKCKCSKVFESEIQFYDHKDEMLNNNPENHKLVWEKVGEIKTNPQEHLEDVKGIEDKSMKENSVLNSASDKAKNWLPCSNCHETFQNKKERNQHMLDEHYKEMKDAGRISKEKNSLSILWILCDYENCKK